MTMLFGDLRKLVYCPLLAVKEEKREWVAAREPHRWDSERVVGVRAREDVKFGLYVEVNLAC